MKGAGGSRVLPPSQAIDEDAGERGQQGEGERGDGDGQDDDGNQRLGTGYRIGVLLDNGVMSIVKIVKLSRYAHETGQQVAPVFRHRGGVEERGRPTR
jgi:hypothetical protein